MNDSIWRQADHSFTYSNILRMPRFLMMQLVASRIILKVLQLCSPNQDCPSNRFLWSF